MEKLILIVDDEPGIIEVMDDYITQAAMAVKVISASSVDAALILVASRHPNLIITDIAMPEKSGLDFMRELQARNVEIPVIVVSGYADEEMVESAWKLGANACLKKPLNRKDFLQSVSILLQKGKDFIFESATAPASRVVQVVLSPGIMKKVGAASAKEKMSVEQWIVAGIEKAVR